MKSRQITFSRIIQFDINSESQNSAASVIMIKLLRANTLWIEPDKELYLYYILYKVVNHVLI
jgi:hypothetical protein